MEPILTCQKFFILPLLIGVSLRFSVKKLIGAVARLLVEKKELQFLEAKNIVPWKDIIETSRQIEP